jgi:hypothetical protein
MTYMYHRNERLLQGQQRPLWLLVVCSLLMLDRMGCRPVQVHGFSDEAWQPYRGPQPAEALPEIFVKQALPTTSASNNDMQDELLWVPPED